MLGRYENKSGAYKFRDNLALFPFKRILTCGECGRSITAEKKVKKSGLLGGTLVPDAFYVEAFNPYSESVNLMLEMRTPDPIQVPFLHKYILAPGINEMAIPFSDIPDIITNSDDLYIALIPEIGSETNLPLTLYFGFIGFANE